MKNILIIFLFATVLNAQALELIYDGETPKWAIDLDGSTEYPYDSSVNGLDLSGSEMITTTADRDFSGVGHWAGMTVSGGVGTFTTTASLATDYYTDMVVGHNYTIQGDFKSAGVLGSDIINGWTFSAGWNASANSAVIDNNSFSSSANGYGIINSSYSLNTKTLFFEISGTTTSAGGLKVVNANGGATPLVCETTTSGAFSISGTISATSNYIYIRNTNAGTTDITSFTIKERTYSSLKFVTDNDSSTFTTIGISATKAFTFTYSGGSQTVQFKGVDTDTWTADNISITEKYDLEIEGNFKANNIATTQYILSTSGGDNIRLGLSSSKLYFRPDNSQSSSYVYSSTLSSNTWYKYKVNYSGLTRVANCYINGILDNGTQSTASTWLNKEAQTSLHIGALSTTYFGGLIGETKLTRKDGTGTVTGTSIYDWKGTSATFLNDKGTNGNNLTGVNVTTADQVKYSTGKYK